jgi:hypothetical protein
VNTETKGTRKEKQKKSIGKQRKAKQGKETKK